MRFIKINLPDDTSNGFCLDDLVTFDSHPDSEDSTIIILRNEKEIVVPVHIDDFCAKVFSDEHEDKEYKLVEIDIEGPRISNEIHPDAF